MGKHCPALAIRLAADADPDLVEAALLDFGIAAINEGAPDSARAEWRVFFHDAASRDAAAAALERAFPHTALTFTRHDVEDEDWAARSQASLRAVRIRDIVVAPPWDLQDDPGTIQIIIHPSMGFGTGHHATTRLCLSALQDLELRGRTVLDVGTGSGVLAIAAAKLGAGQVLAIDSDPDASESARENLQINGATNVSLGTTDIRDLTLKPFDLLLANLTGALLVTAAPRLLGLCKGHLVVSGLTAPEEAEVLSAFTGCRVASRAQEDEWICLTLSSG